MSESKREQGPTASGETKCVEVAETRSGLLVKFAYHPKMVARIARVAGAEFVPGKGGYVIDKAAKAEALAAVAEMEQIGQRDLAGKAEIATLATRTAREMMKDRGTPAGVAPRLSEFKEAGRTYRGEVLNANGEYLAQLTGFGNEDGAAFVTLHRLADLDTDGVFKGERVAITYQKGRGAVEAMPPDFEKTLGQEVDGVRVTEQGDKLQVTFAFNSRMSERLNRVAGVEFNKEAKSYEVPAEHREFVARAVADMRRIHVSEVAELRELQGVASERMDGAMIVHPLLRGANGYSGEIVASGDAFVLQHTGRNYFTAHRIQDLDNVPAVGDKAKIKYEHMRGQVAVVAQERGRAHGR